MPNRRSVVTRLLAGGLIATGATPWAWAAPTAPDFAGIEGWLNTPSPLTIEGLRGRLVLVDFWTYSCINCRRTVPYLNRWQAEYGVHGLQVVGVHTPEFGFEHARTNVQEAVRRLGIRFPVGQDNRAQTWRAWGNTAWPAFYLVDRNGRTVLARSGEGFAGEFESAIRGLLGLSPAPRVPDDDPDLSRVGTPEIYFGAHHPTPQDRTQQPRRGDASYEFPAGGPKAGEYQLGGTWAREGEALSLRSARGGLRLRYSAAKLHLVASAVRPASVRVAVDGAPATTIEVEQPTLYTLHDGTTYGEHIVEIEIDAPGLSLFSATFG